MNCQKMEQQTSMKLLKKIPLKTFTFALFQILEFKLRKCKDEKENFLEPVG